MSQPTDEPILIYVASPYGTDPKLHQQRRQLAQAFGREALRTNPRAAVFYMPIAMLTDWAEPEHGIPLTVWPGQEQAWMAQADGLWVLEMPGWDVSPGVAREIELARARALPIRQINPGITHEQIGEQVAATRASILGVGDKTTAVGLDPE